MPAEPRLTKKQKKGIAFRERKGKGKAAPDEPADVPELDIQDEPESTIDVPASERSGPPESSKPRPESQGKKRKRSETSDAGGQAEVHPPDIGKASGKRLKKRKTEDAGETKEVEGETAERADAKAKKFILFVGNLPYTISKEEIQAHFDECKPPPSIRLLTPKARGGKPQTAVQAAKSKGCAFLEFSSHSAMQLGIRRHHTELAGRRINVELTAGGGGNSGQRKEKLRTRNRTLDEQRVRPIIRADRLASKNPGANGPSQPQSRMPIRHSTTSGAAEQPIQPRTWSVPNAKDDEIGPKKRGRMGKGAKAAQTRHAWTPSGANAITVG
ncbi:hypothetical protein BDV93DRAFT_448856 [Ceratobasidium sp. AG-I]|nr:hypothetical protein BDV93DRAFT_448856 [Ceratobasidium sp. AG-I]